MKGKTDSRSKILDVALTLIRTKGFEATTVDDVCAAAGVSKGAFFHHFKGKEDLAVQAAEHWTTTTGDFFASAPYHSHEDPLDRILGYVKFRKTLLQGTIPAVTCLAGMMVQEVYETHPAVREACRESIFGHAEKLVEDIDQAKKKYAPGARWSSKGLALHTQAVLQGAFILAKAGGDVDFAAESVDHLYRYIEFLFGNSPRNKGRKENPHVQSENHG